MVPLPRQRGRKENAPPRPRERTRARAIPHGETRKRRGRPSRRYSRSLRRSKQTENRPPGSPGLSPPVFTLSRLRGREEGAQQRNKKEREAERRQARTQRPHPAGCGARHARTCHHARTLRARSPVGVPLRRSRQRPNAAAQLQPTRFLGPASSGVTCIFAYPSPAGDCPQTGHRAGRAFPPEPPGSEVTSPARRHRTRPVSRRSTGDVPDGRDSLLIASFEGLCQGIFTYSPIAHRVVKQRLCNCREYV
jgi:hypothetical protein